jgi:hypothetical protein
MGLLRGRGHGWDGGGGASSSSAGSRATTATRAPSKVASHPFVIRRTPVCHEAPGGLVTSWRRADSGRFDLEWTRNPVSMQFAAVAQVLNHFVQTTLQHDGKSEIQRASGQVRLTSGQRHAPVAGLLGIVRGIGCQCLAVDGCSLPEAPRRLPERILRRSARCLSHSSNPAAS